MRKTSIFKRLIAVLLAVVALSSVTACVTSEPIDMSQVAAVIDVRTAPEFASGHLTGAVNIDIQSADFTSQIDALDKSANYVVYCHSGNRARAAVEYMTSNGFTGSIINAGGISDAANATKLAIVN